MTALAFSLFSLLCCGSVLGDVRSRPRSRPAGPRGRNDTALQTNLLESPCKEKPLDFVLVIDSSRSVRPHDYEKVKTFITNILRFLDVGPNATRVGLLQYGSVVQNEFSLKTFHRKADMERAVRAMFHLASGTMTGLALEYTMNVAFSEAEGARPLHQHIPRIAMVVTDGRPQDTVVEVAARARQAGIQIFAIGVGRVDMSTLRAIGSEPHFEHVYLVANFSQIQTLTSVFQSKLCGGTSLCSVVDHRCEHICVSTPTSYLCRCRKGYVLKPDGKTCRGIDQCALGTHGCEHQCVNTEDSFVCRCRKGYKLNPDGKTCKKIDQCALGTHGCEHECVNTEDSFVCRCRKGYTLNPDGKTCKSIDVCSTVSHGCEHVCLSTPDSYICQCREGYTLAEDGKSCKKLECRDGALDLVFVIDGSKSLGPANFQVVKQFVIGIVDALDVSARGTRVGLLQYSTKVRAEFTLGQFSSGQEVKEAVSRMQYMGRGSMTGSALRHMFEFSFSAKEGARPNTRRISIVFTDGRSQDDVSKWATNAQESGITVYAVGVGKAIEEELREIASEPDDNHLFYVEDFSLMGQITDKLKTRICKEKPSNKDLCKCENMVSFQSQATEQLRTLTQTHILLKFQRAGIPSIYSEVVLQAQ
ncbi:hypothetical protein SKAU_G00214200 [Synaphobranchus kaupii]|uniref:Matrilin 2 n=1 Tax=Synaphobranchus kaupii TaxID=118154 RepID=A0A9Q1IVC2_SYNKA|nr:hypothetical protein SKAU_G00214200 [Synaphobranchus kaupii]